jgi:hypothetical protein
MRTLLLTLLLLLPAGVLVGQNEFLVNTTLDSTQRDPQIARDGSGNSVVVWKSVTQVDSASKGDLYLQFFDPSDQRIGSETLINTVTAGDQDKPAIAMNTNGDLIVVWASYTGFSEIYDIKGRLYKNRLPAGDEFLINTTVQYTQTNPAVAINDAGQFVVTWDSWFQDGSDKGVFAQRFDASGVPLGSEFQINTTTAYSQTKPSVKYFPDGKFVVTWESWKQDLATPSGYGLIGRIFNADGTPVSGEFQINTYTNDYQWFGDIEVFEDNTFVVAWCSWAQDGDEGGIYVQRFDQSGTKVGSETLVNKSTANYQWLPKVVRTTGKDFAVVWSSWKQDGSREGIYVTLFDSTARAVSFETRVNETTYNFQWEPDMVSTGGDELLFVWSSWSLGNDYDIVGRRLSLQRPQARLDPSVYNHYSGRSTARITVHVTDSTALTGNEYEVRFDSLGTELYMVDIRNIATGDTLVQDYPIDRGKGVFYLTPEFEGVAVEILPEFTLDLDVGHSWFFNSSGTNLLFTPGASTVGIKLIAPIDVALVWGPTDTLADGHYASPLDTALNIGGARTVAVPFRGINLTDGEKMSLLVSETTTGNKKFDPGEKIVFLTPVRYRKAANNTHAQIATSLPGGTLVWPQPGDTNFVLTTRPLTREDSYRFTTTKSAIVNVDGMGSLQEMRFELAQNYPNPFNPTTTIVYTIPRSGYVRLALYNLLGQRVMLLADELQKAGQHRILLNGGTLSAGVYFYALQFDEQFITKKMLLLK